jgi:hypothetical protein
MKVTAAALAGALAIALASDGRPRVERGAGESLLVLYVGAEDCGPCRTWRQDHKPRLVSELEGRASYREVIAPKLAHAFDESGWPSDLLPFRRDAEAVAGVPLWLVIRDGQVIASAGGLSRWRSAVLPALRKPGRS